MGCRRVTGSTNGVSAVGISERFPLFVRGTEQEYSTPDLEVISSCSNLLDRTDSADPSCKTPIFEFGNINDNFHLNITDYRFCLHSSRGKFRPVKFLLFTRVISSRSALGFLNSREFFPIEIFPG